MLCSHCVWKCCTASRPTGLHYMASVYCRVEPLPLGRLRNFSTSIRHAVQGQYECCPSYGLSQGKGSHHENGKTTIRTESLWIASNPRSKECVRFAYAGLGALHCG